MTLREFELRMFAYRLSLVDEEMERHQQAFLNDAVRARDKKGNPVYEEFSDFYNYKERLEETLDGTEFSKGKLDEKRIDELKKVGKRLREYRERRGTT